MECSHRGRARRPLRRPCSDADRAEWGERRRARFCVWGFTGFPSTRSRGARGVTHPALPDQPHRLKLELSRKAPSSHSPPLVPSSHLTRCPRSRQQARPRTRIVCESNIDQMFVHDAASRQPTIWQSDSTPGEHSDIAGRYARAVAEFGFACRADAIESTVVLSILDLR